MTFLIILALLVCIVALVMTLVAVGRVDLNYSMNTSLKNLSVIYMIIVPVVIILFGVIWFFFM